MLLHWFFSPSLTQSRIVLPSSCLDPSPQGQGNKQDLPQPQSSSTWGKAGHTGPGGLSPGCAHGTHTQVCTTHPPATAQQLALSTAGNVALSHTTSLCHTPWSSSSSQPSLQISHMPAGAGSTPMQQQGQHWVVMAACTHLACGNVYRAACTGLCILTAVCSPTELGAEAVPAQGSTQTSPCRELPKLGSDGSPSQRTSHTKPSQPSWCPHTMDTNTHSLKLKLQGHPYRAIKLHLEFLWSSTIFSYGEDYRCFKTAKKASSYSSQVPLF